MAFPTTPVLDNFNRADNTTLGANWQAPIFSADQSPVIGTNAIGSPSVSFSGDAIYTALGQVTIPCEVYCTYSVAGNNAGVEYLVTNIGAAPNGYRCFYVTSNTTLRLLRYTAGGSFTTILTTTQTVSAGDKFGVSVSNASLHSIWYAPAGVWQGSPLATVTDTTWTNGNLGVFIDAASQTTRIDDFGGGGGTPAPGFVPQFAKIRFGG